MGEIKTLADKVWKEGRVPPNERVRQFTDLLDDVVYVAGDDPQFTTIELGHATDTTLARASAGDMSIEGNIVYRSGGTDIAVADGGTGASTAAGAATNLGLGTGDSPQFTAVNIGHASDTTVARAVAGELSVEGSRVYQRSNILGTVSESSGTPTGAIIERGSSADGSYTRLADGTQICFHSLTTDAGSSAVWTFPASFVSSSSLFLSGNVVGVTAGHSVIFPAFNSSSASVRAFLHDNTQVAETVHVQAVGRWF